MLQRIKNFLDQEKTLKLVYPAHNELKEEDPTPINKHIKVDYYLPQCPPSKKEIVSFIRCIAKGEVWKDYNDPVCVECRSKGNPCLLDQKKIGYNKKEMHDKMRTFSGLQFRDQEGGKTWLEK